MRASSSCMSRGLGSQLQPQHAYTEMHLGSSTSPESMNIPSHLVFSGVIPAAALIFSLSSPLLNILTATHAHEPARGAVPTLGRFSLDENSDKLQLYWLQIQTNLGSWQLLCGVARCALKPPATHPRPVGSQSDVSCITITTLCFPSMKATHQLALARVGLKGFGFSTFTVQFDR